MTINKLRQLVPFLFPATAQSDFLTDSVDLVFMPSTLASQSLCHTITTLNDTVLESTEVFSVELNTADSAVNLNASSAVVEIINDDCK